MFKEECKALPEAITLYAEGGLEIQGRRVRGAVAELSRQFAQRRQLIQAPAARSARGWRTARHAEHPPTAPSIGCGRRHGSITPCRPVGLVVDELRPIAPQGRHLGIELVGDVDDHVWAARRFADAR